jgi:hypothetical protein
VHRNTTSYQPVSRFPTFPAALVLLLAGSLVACSAIKVDAAKSESVTGDPDFSNVLVVGVSPDRNVRCAFEQALADNLRSASSPRQPPAAIMAADAKLSREAVEAVVKSTGVDAVITTSLVAVKGGAKKVVHGMSGRRLLQTRGLWLTMATLEPTAFRLSMGSSRRSVQSCQ